MLAIQLDKPGDVNLNKIPTKETGGMTEPEALERLKKLGEELFDLQEELYAAAINGMLVVLQGRDTAGKDGTLKAIAGAMNPVGIGIASFKVPTPEEASHDFLWRIHQKAPGRGQIVFFNRSHYEDVLAARVHNLVPRDVWKERYQDINHFEDILHDAGIIVVKFCLHISKEEQERRLLAREVDAEKAWKLSPGDWQERAFWDEYTTAYEDALGRCATKHAPWYIVPADHKWFRNVAVAEVLVRTLHAYRPMWDKRLVQIGNERRAELARMRAGGNDGSDTKAGGASSGGTQSAGGTSAGS